jgi:hypothetical protein
MKSDGSGHDRGSAFGDVSLDLRLEMKRRIVGGQCQQNPVGRKRCEV